jgi:hypothetical protein
MCATRPSHLILLQLIILVISCKSTIDHWRSRCKAWILWPTPYTYNILQEAQIIKLLNMQFFSSHLLLLPSQVQMFSSKPILKHPKTTLFLNFEDKIPQPYKTTSKFIVLRILIFMLLNSKWEDKMFWAERKEAFPDKVKNVKLFLCLTNWALTHEGVWGVDV